MKIILVGGGKVGTALTRQLSEEGHNVTVVDTNKARVEHLTESYDVLGIVGNGSSITTLSEAGIEDADVFIAVTGSDELNLLCCMFDELKGKIELKIVSAPACATRPTATSWTLSKSRSVFPPLSTRKWQRQRRSLICCVSPVPARSIPLRTAVCG